jgi:outer membrane protein assembly factor BamB
MRLSSLLGLTLVMLAIGSASLYSAFPVSGSVSSHKSGINHAGNILVTDQYNNRVIEVDPATKSIVWSFGSGNGMLCNPGPHSIIGSNDAERLADGLTVIVGTGIPDGVPNTTACVDNRVIVVNQEGEIVWQYGVAGVTGSGPNQLSTPVFVIETPNHSFMIVDQGNNRVIEVNKQHQIVWSYGPSSGPGALNNPNSAELLRNGHVLIADENNNRVIEVSRTGNIVWQFSNGLSGAAFASRLPNGHTLITDSNHARIVEITKTGKVVFQYFTNQTKDSNPNPLPTNAVRLRNGNTVIADQFNNRVLVIDDEGETVFQYGVTNVAGNGPDRLYGPYTAYVIGDYTGQTRPPHSF